MLLDQRHQGVITEEDTLHRLFELHHRHSQAKNPS
jgi:hypothetical protein